MSKRTIPSKFSRVYRTAAGAKFHGELNFASQDGSDFFVPIRFLTVARNSVVVLGDVIVTDTDERFILGQHVSYRDVITYKAYRVDRTATWTRTTDITDLATGMQRQGLPVSQGTLELTFEPIRQVKDFDITAELSRFVTGQAVEEGDLVDGKRITRILDQIGLSVCEVG